MKTFLTGAISDLWPSETAPSSLQPGEVCLQSGWDESSELMCFFVEHLALVDCRPNISLGDARTDIYPQQEEELNKLSTDMCFWQWWGLTTM